jgi:hypothetical protein
VEGFGCLFCGVLLRGRQLCLNCLELRLCRRQLCQATAASCRQASIEAREEHALA